MKKDDNESITEATFVFNPFAMLGKAGRYMSIDNGPMAARSPKISMRKNCGCFFT